MFKQRQNKPPRALMGARSTVATLDARIDPADAAVELDGGTGLRLDARGRWCSLRTHGQLFRRTLAGEVVTYLQPRPSPSPVSDPAGCHEAARRLAAALHRRISDGEGPLRLSGAQPDRAELLARLARAERWSAAEHAREAQRFTATYPEPVEILPPDRTMDVVALPAIGCPNAGCTFCAFYRARRFRPQTPQAFAAHLEAVRELLGPLLALRSGVFLGSASALSLSQPRLLAALAACAAQLGERRRGVAAFWDPDHAPARNPSDWQALHGAGLRAVYLGLETGLAPLRAALGKSPDLDGLLSAVAAQRRAPLRTGVIVLAGAGGATSVTAHAEATATMIARMDLGARDLVFVSPLRDALPADQLVQAAHALRQAIAARSAAQVAPYAMDAFRYYS
ncbi:MAG: hypothetical protein IPL40_11490 [Proteobacteria bacterium]|nr:hypothetical protein [Pseudomonadota bacterium]